MDDSLFDKPASEWSDDEIRVGLSELAKAIDWHDEQRDFDRSAELRAIHTTVDEERRNRVELANDVEDSFADVRLVERPGREVE